MPNKHGQGKYPANIPARSTPTPYPVTQQPGVQRPSGSPPGDGTRHPRAQRFPTDGPPFGKPAVNGGIK